LHIFPALRYSKCAYIDPVRAVICVSAETYNGKTVPVNAGKTDLILKDRYYETLPF